MFWILWVSNGDFNDIRVNTSGILQGLSNQSSSQFHTSRFPLPTKVKDEDFKGREVKSDSYLVIKKSSHLSMKGRVWRKSIFKGFKNKSLSLSELESQIILVSILFDRRHSALCHWRKGIIYHSSTNLATYNRYLPVRHTDKSIMKIISVFLDLRPTTWDGTQTRQAKVSMVLRIDKSWTYAKIY